VAELGRLPLRNYTVDTTVGLDTLTRTTLVLATFLVVCISFRPFLSLAEPLPVTETGYIVNQIGYSLLFLALASWCLLHDPTRLLVLLRPILMMALLWCALSVIASWEPSLSARRFGLMLMTISIAGMVILLPKNVRHFGSVMAAVALIVLALCYFGVFFFPARSIHQATDFLEPDLAGDWRGVFGHKNDASATMVLFVFIGLFVARVRSLALGGVIVALAFTFLLFTYSKTAIAALPLVLIVSTIMARVRRPGMGIVLALSIVLVINIFSVGSVYFEPVRHLLDQVLTDSTFTGRTEVWEFAVNRMLERPITGYGFSAFWGTPEVVYGMGGNTIWANTAGHAHNGYLDLALTVGIPGSVLVTLWLLVLPLFDFYRAPHDPSGAPLEMLFLRICLFAAYESCFESVLVPEGTLALFLVMGTFGLRFLSVSPVTE
jgi:O-antigen ligase